MEPPTAGTRLSVIDLNRRVEAIFSKAGLSDTQAPALARAITAAERDACQSHGIYRIEGCLRTVKAGKVEPAAEPVLQLDDTAVVRVDAKCGFSCPAVELGLPPLAERAQAYGLAALVINNCTHFSALWYEIELLTQLGLAGLAMCPSYATVAPTGGSRPLLGTNPLAFGWPRPNQHPYVFDFATSVAARGEIELYRRAGEQLPEGWALDADGAPTNDPDAALAGAMLPFGGHKGSAISTMIELLAAAMIGDLTSQEALDQLGSTTLAPRHGELIIAFDPLKFSFSGSGDPFSRAETILSSIVGQGARLPSSRRYAARVDAELNGVAISGADAAMLDRLLAGGLDAIA